MGQRGFGMGIIDSALARRGPGHHTIIEAHPAVYAKMVEAGWTTRPNVTVAFGRWQDVIQSLGTFDGIFFDIFLVLENYVVYHLKMIEIWSI